MIVKLIYYHYSFNFPKKYVGKANVIPNYAFASTIQKKIDSKANEVLLFSRLTTKKGPNCYRKFFTCDEVDYRYKCKFFQWADETGQ